MILPSFKSGPMRGLTEKCSNVEDHRRRFALRVQLEGHGGDNPHLIHKDARHLSRKEGYRSREKPTIGRQRRKGQARYLALS